MSRSDSGDGTEPATGLLSYNEEASWAEHLHRPDSFAGRALVLTVDLPSGARQEYARGLLAHVTSRHEILRTGYRPAGDQARRVVHRDVAHPVVIPEDGEPPPIGGSGPGLDPADLVRARLTEAPQRHHQLSLELSSMITDAWSTGRLQQELTALAAGTPVGATPSPDGPVTGYSVYAREQREQSLPNDARDYWRRHLAGLADPCYLPADGPDPSGDTAGERVTVLPAEVTRTLRQLGSRYRASPFMTIVALVTTVLAARRGAHDIVLATAIGTRPGRWADAQGNFDTPVLLRNTMAPDASFADVVASSRATVLGGMTHQAHPQQLHEVVGHQLPQPPVRISYLPRGTHHYTELDAKAQGASWREETRFATWPVEIGFVEDNHRRITVWLNYDATRFTHASMDRLLDSFLTTVGLVAADPDVTCAAVAAHLVATA
jgi:hypothetical protein